MLQRIAKLLRMQPPAVGNVGLLFASGLVVPVDGTAGYQTGCVFQHTDGTTGTALYINEGTATSCDFNANATSAAESLTGLSDVGAALAYTAGKILVADGVDYEEVAVSGDATLAASGALTVPLLSAVAGVATASKAAKLDANKAIDAVRTASLLLGASGAEVAVTASAAELNYCDVTTPGTVEASKAVVVDASKNASAFAALGCVDLDAGSSGVAGSVDVFPALAVRGKLALTCTEQTGDTIVSLVVGAMAAARTINLPDPGAASYIMQSAVQITLAEVGVLSGVTPGTAAASKAVVLGAAGEIASIVSATITNLTATNLSASVAVADAADVSVGTTTGTKIGTAANQKLSLWGVAPVIQPAGAAQADPAAYATGAFGLDSDAKMQALFDLVVAMRTALVAAGIIKGAA